MDRFSFVFVFFLKETPSTARYQKITAMFD